MPFIPHTEKDIQSMLSSIGMSSLDALFSEIPKHLKINEIPGIPKGMSEQALAMHFETQLAQDKSLACFLGAGAYRHYIPAAVWEIVSRGEFLTAYTPYQAEASQGTLQLLWEYQSMMSALMGLDVSNASLYDGATALAEAVLMACRLHKKAGTALIGVPNNIHPHYRAVLQTIAERDEVKFVFLDFDASGRVCVPAKLEQLTALVIAQPNFFGVLEDVDALTDWTHAQEAYVIALVNPMVMSLLKPPGQWGQKGADIACGEGQPLGVPLSSGGPYFGFLCCQKALVRQLPGRLVGQTEDKAGKIGYALTLQAREQHIRRAKATSNICTNQGLLVTAATIYMSLMGAQGLRNTATLCAYHLADFSEKLLKIPGVRSAFQADHFHEKVIQFSVPVQTVVNKMLEKGFLAGYPLTSDYPELGEALLVCTTELNTPEQSAAYCQALAEVLG